jgi:hypothetical protein
MHGILCVAPCMQATLAAPLRGTPGDRPAGATPGDRPLKATVALPKVCTPDCSTRLPCKP